MAAKRKVSRGSVREGDIRSRSKGSKGRKRAAEKVSEPRSSVREGDIQSRGKRRKR